MSPDLEIIASQIITNYLLSKNPKHLSESPNLAIICTILKILDLKLTFYICLRLKIIFYISINHIWNKE